MAAIFGGGNKDAKRAAERTRQSNRISNERQLNQANKADKRTKVSRKAPRGRKLFENAGSLDLSNKL